MTTTAAALEALKGPVLPDTIAGKSGRTISETLADLTMLEISGQAEAVGARWFWTGKGGEIAPAPSARPARKAVPRKAKAASAAPAAPKAAPSRRAVVGGTVRKAGEKREPAERPRSRPYPIQIVTTRWVDPKTGRFVRTPREGVPLTMRVMHKARPLQNLDDLHVTRQFRKDPRTGERVPHRYTVKYPKARAAAARGELSKAGLAELEREIAEGLLTTEGQDVLRRAEIARGAHESAGTFYGTPSDRPLTPLGHKLLGALEGGPVYRSELVSQFSSDAASFDLVHDALRTLSADGYIDSAGRKYELTARGRAALPGTKAAKPKRGGSAYTGAQDSAAQQELGEMRTTLTSRLKKPARKRRSA